MISLAHSTYTADVAKQSGLLTKTVGFHALDAELTTTLRELMDQLTMPVLWREATEKEADVIFVDGTAFNWRTGRTKDASIDTARCIVLSDKHQSATHPYVLKTPLKARTLINCLNELCVKPSFLYNSKA